MNNHKDAIALALDALTKCTKWHPLNNGGIDLVDRAIAALSTISEALEQSHADSRQCTCSTDDNRPTPCAKQYALRECVAMAQSHAQVRDAALEPLASDTERLDHMEKSQMACYPVFNCKRVYRTDGTDSSYEEKIFVGWSSGSTDTDHNTLREAIDAQMKEPT